MTSILSSLKHDDKKLAVLVDPDKTQTNSISASFIKKINALKPNYVFIGGSTVEPSQFANCVEELRQCLDIPLIIFPGSHNQIHKAADAILFLSLISGRNPDYLIGHHIESAHLLKKMNLEVIPTGYLLIDGGKNSSVQYVSQTTPIPADQYSIAIKTAIAGELLGMQSIFLDAGSGACKSISEKMIRSVKENITIPLIVGGGIRSVDQVITAFDSGANVVVIGNKIEEDDEFLVELIGVTSRKTTI